MTILRLSLRTTDNELISAIENIKSTDLKISMFTKDSMLGTAGTSGMTDLIPYILTISSSVVAGVIVELLKTYINKKPNEKTIINNIDMTNNDSQVYITINNYIQEQKFEEEKKNKVS